MLEITPKIETKNVKHTFSDPELLTLGADLARSFAALRGLEGEFDQVKEFDGVIEAHKERAE